MAPVARASVAWAPGETGIHDLSPKRPLPHRGRLGRLLRQRPERQLGRAHRGGRRDPHRHRLPAQLAASGWHKAAITMNLLVTSGLPFAHGLIGAGAELSWPTATRPEDVLHAEAVVTEIKPSRSRPDRGIVTVESRTLTADGAERQLLVPRMLVFRRGSTVTPDLSGHGRLSGPGLLSGPGATTAGARSRRRPWPRRRAARP